MKQLLLLSAIILSVSACAPQRLQSAQIVDYHNGSPVYTMSGYTDPGDIQSGASKKYIEYAMAKACPDGIKIVSMNEQESGNAFSKFLYWTAKAECI